MGLIQQEFAWKVKHLTKSRFNACHGMKLNAHPKLSSRRRSRRFQLRTSIRRIPAGLKDREASYFHHSKGPTFAEPTSNARTGDRLRSNAERDWSSIWNSIPVFTRRRALGANVWNWRLIRSDSVARISINSDRNTNWRNTRHFRIRRTVRGSSRVKEDKLFPTSDHAQSRLFLIQKLDCVNTLTLSQPATGSRRSNGSRMNDSEHDARVCGLFQLAALSSYNTQFFANFASSGR